MAYSKTTALTKIQKLNKRLRIIQGGSSAGKTIAILILLIDLAQRRKNLLISVVSETVPHLKRGAIRDFIAVMEAQGDYEDARWNRTDFFYEFETGSKIEFFSADSPDKVRGPRRDILFINECNNVSFETYTQLAIRTNEDIYLDFNPVQVFWVHDEIIDKGVDHDFIKLTYLDNEGLPDTIKAEIESRKNNRYFWTVYGLGELGEVEGKVYTGWREIEEIPHEARLERYGIDFGYTNDPTSIVALYYYNGGYILDELAYTKGLSYKQIADIILAQPKRAMCIADSAEPRGIDEIRGYGVLIQPTVKGKDSIVNGITVVQDQQISITKRSTNTLKEYRNYMWEKDKDGRTLNEPSPIFNHSMDAIRYAITSLAPIKRRQEFMSTVEDLHYRPGVNPAL